MTAFHFDFCILQFDFRGRRPRKRKVKMQIEKRKLKNASISGPVPRSPPSKPWNLKPKTTHYPLSPPNSSPSLSTARVQSFCAAEAERRITRPISSNDCRALRSSITWR
jgi:hypothetical protein